MPFKDVPKRDTTVAPDIDQLLNYFRRNDLNARRSRPKILKAAQDIFAELADLAPLKENEEVRSIWLRVPRGGISDFTPFEEMKEWGEVETQEEYERLWQETYPDAYKWYDLTVAQSFSEDGKLRYYGLSLDRYSIISASL